MNKKRAHILYLMMAASAVIMATETATETATDSLGNAQDSIIVSAPDTVTEEPDPEWYVAPLVREPLRAPRRATAATCDIDSIQTYNVDSVLESVAVYEYGDTTRTMTWTVNSDGTRVGTGRTEEGTNGNTTFTATYAWDNASRTWKGTTKEEHTYAGPGGKETLRTVYDWVNNAWTPLTKYTWAYDAAGRETEYTTYQRNNAGALAYSKQRIREYNAAGKMTLDIQYTAHNGTEWSAGTKSIYDYDGSYTTLNEYYSAYTNGQWVGSTRKVWEYTGGKNTYYEQSGWSNGGWVYSYKENWEYTAGNKTYYDKQTWSSGAWVGSTKEIWEYYNNNSSKRSLYKKYGWSNGDWAITQRDSSVYDAAGNNILIENYTYTNGVKKGTKKEEYTFNANNKKIETLKYAWIVASGNWRENTRLVNSYDAAGNTIETANYLWSNDAWKGTGSRTLTTFNSSKKATEVITQLWSADAAAWVNSTRKTTDYDGSKTTQEATYSWQNDTWVGTSRSDWHYNAAGKNDTIKTYTHDGTNWIYSDRTAKTYNAAGTEIMVHNAHWDGTKWAMTSMTRSDISDITVDGIRQTLNASWQCTSDSVWTGIKKDTMHYVAGNLTYEAHYTSWANNNWVPSFKIEYQYDEANRKTMQQRFNWKNNDWYGDYCNIFKYDERGRQITLAYYLDWDNIAKKWIGSTQTEYTYYGNTNLVLSSISSVGEGTGWSPLFRYQYSYDESGREILRTEEHYGNDWEYTNRYLKEYKGNVLVKDNTYLWQINQWVFISRNETYYDNDAQAKLRRQITGSWNSTTGALQSFSDNHYFYACDPKYTIRFVNDDNTPLISDQVLLEGRMPSVPAAPTKAADAQYTYTFAGWDKAIAAATADVTYTATYNSTVNKYTITFKNEDGAVLKSETLDYGTMPTAPVDPTKDATAQYTYAFAGWDRTIATVTGEATYNATFNSTVNKYTIKWVNEEGTELKSETLDYGTMPTAPADPTKAATAQYTYTFKSWDNEIASVIGEATYTAIFDSTVNKYLITFKNDETTLQSTEVAYGVTPEYTGITPIKQGDAQYTYTFKGWDIPIATVTKDTTYTATFSSTVNKYTIKWVNEEGTEISRETLEYGAMPQHSGLTKPNTAEFTYTFDGWTPAIQTVTKDTTYKAVFSRTKNSYTIKWVNEEGTEISRETLEYGAMPQHDNLIKPNTAEFTYTFDGWTPAIQTVTKDTTYKAVFSSSKNSYTIKWVNEEGTEISRETLEYGATPAHDDLTKPNTAEFTYTFDGWTPAIQTVTKDTTYKAVFSSSKNSYTIKWVNEEGTEISRETLEYGATPQHSDLTKPNTAEFTYTFDGWTPAIQTVTKDTTYKAVFNSTKNSYTIKWVNEEGTEISRETLEYGATPQHSDLTKPNTAEFTYTFDGWTPTIETVTKDTTYKAVFSSSKNSYTIKWVNEEGTEISRETLEYGATPQHSDLTKPNTAEFTYTFAGWTPAIQTVTKDTTYKAVFSSSKNSYTIKWVNEDGTELKSETLEYGATPTAPADPTKDATAQYSYTFAGWDKEITAVTGEATYTATYTETQKGYTITWRNDDGSLIEETIVEFGIAPAHANINKESTAQYTFTFKGWSPVLEPVSGNATYTAVFDTIVNTYTVTFYFEDGTTVLDQVTVAYGETPSTHLTPSEPMEEHYYYTFAGWSPEIVPVTGEASYTAVFTRKPKDYTITFRNYDKTLLQTAVFPYGGTPVYSGEEPARKPNAQYTYTFAGWSPEIATVTGDATYTAVFDAELNSYTVTWLNEDGTELDQQTVEYGAMPVYDGETPTKEADDQYIYTFKGWTPAVVHVTRDATYRATYTSQDKSQALEDVQGNNVQCTKILRGDQIYILRGNKTYTLQGVEVEE